MSRPGVVGSSPPQTRSTSSRAPASATSRPPGSRVGSAPASTAPRSPARRGTQAIRAPVVEASRAASVSSPAPRPRARRPARPRRAAAAPRPRPWPRRSRPARPRRRPSSRPPSAPAPAPAAPHRGVRAVRRAERGQHPRLVAGHGRQQGAERLAHAVGQPGRDREQLLPALAGGLAQPEEDDRRLLLGLEADQQHRRRRLQLRVRHRAGLRAEPGHPGGEEVELLGRVRPGPGVDVVGAERDPGELRVRVGVLDGEPAAGQHADAAAVAGLAQRLGRPLQRVGPARSAPARRCARPGPAARSAGRPGWRR